MRHTDSIGGGLPHILGIAHTSPCRNSAEATVESIQINACLLLRPCLVGPASSSTRSEWPPIAMYGNNNVVLCAENPVHERGNVLPSDLWL